MPVDLEQLHHETIMNPVSKRSTRTSHSTVTVLIDNSVANSLQSEHGLSLWLEFGDKRVLFDTGQTDMILGNAKVLGIHLENTDAIVLSHGHYDHTGGLNTVLDSASHAILYLHPETMKPKYSQKDKSTRMIGISASIKEAICGLADHSRVVWTEQPTEIFPGLFVTGRIPRNNDFEDTGGNFFTQQSCQETDELPDDQAIYFMAEQGLVILLGCAHAGVVNTLDYITKITSQPNVYAIIGGMHLIHANEARIERTIETFQKYEIQKIIPLHCTGLNAKEQLKTAFGGKCSFEGIEGHISF
jgi:7,8-dihydropterin-6-yl-methyl-4-(beta-D-ribofuranosyl)aminobenzene 5'-phosphate synthase